MCDFLWDLPVVGYRAGQKPQQASPHATGGDHMNPEITVFTLWGQPKWPVRVVLTLPGEGVTAWRAFPEVESGLRQVPGKGA